MSADPSPRKPLALREDAASEDVPLSWLIRRRLRMGKSMEQAMGGRKVATA